MKYRVSVITVMKLNFQLAALTFAMVICKNVTTVYRSTVHATYSACADKQSTRSFIKRS